MMKRTITRRSTLAAAGAAALVPAQGLADASADGPIAFALAEYRAAGAGISAVAELDLDDPRQRAADEAFHDADRRCAEACLCPAATLQGVLAKLAYVRDLAEWDYPPVDWVTEMAGKVAASIREDLERMSKGRGA